MFQHHSQITILKFRRHRQLDCLPNEFFFLSTQRVGVRLAIISANGTQISGIDLSLLKGRNVLSMPDEVISFELDLDGRTIVDRDLNISITVGLH